MTQDYDGVELVDSDGESLGKVERTFVDDANAPRFVEVKFGTLLPKHRLIPVSDADLTDDGQLQVPFSKETIEASPDAPKADLLETADLEAINSYYGDEGTVADDNPAAPATSTPPATVEENLEAAPDAVPHRQFDVIDESAGELRVGDQIPAGLEAPIRDRGDVVEVPVLEEVLVKKTVVRDIIRVKKSDIVEQETIQGDVRKEDVEIDDEAGAVVDSNPGPASR